MMKDDGQDVDGSHHHRHHLFFFFLGVYIVCILEGVFVINSWSIESLTKYEIIKPFCSDLHT